jgi:hypothetical protein
VLERIVAGDVPAKHHIALRHGGALRHEECLTRDGFDGPYTIPTTCAGRTPSASRRGAGWLGHARGRAWRAADRWPSATT